MLSEIEIISRTLFQNKYGGEKLNLQMALKRFKSMSEFKLYRKLIEKHKIIIINGEGSFYDQQY